MVLAPASALTMLMSYPSFSRANIEKIVPMSLKKTAISNKHAPHHSLATD